MVICSADFKEYFGSIVVIIIEVILINTYLFL